MGYVVKNKKVFFINPQIGGTNCDKYFKAYAEGKVDDTTVNFVRLDDLEIKPRQILKAVSNRT